MTRKNMRTALWILLAIVALLTPAVVFPRTTPAWISGEQIFAAFALWPCLIVASVGFIYGIFSLLEPIRRGAAIAMILLSLVMPSAIGYRMLSFQMAYDASYAWFSQTGGAGILNFYLHDYIRDNPDSISYPYPNSEEVFVEGFWQHIASKAPFSMRDHSGRSRRMKMTDEGLATSWGALIRLAVDRDRDGYISVGDQKSSSRYGFANPKTDRPDYAPGLATAVFLSLPDKVLVDADSSLVTLDEETFQRLDNVITRK